VYLDVLKDKGNCFKFKIILQIIRNEASWQIMEDEILICRVATFENNRQQQDAGGRRDGAFSARATL
jgi:hypothetical protein